MDPTLERRISSIIDNRNAQYIRNPGDRDDVGKRRRLAYSRLTAELHRLCAKITGAVADLNDHLHDTDIWLEIDHIERTMTSDGVYTIRIAGEHEPTLIFTVDWTGTLRGILRTGQASTLLRSYAIYSLTPNDIMEMLVSLLETLHR